MFTSDLLDPHARCEPAGPLRHVAGFPGLRLLRVLRPIPAASAGDGPSRRSAGSRPVRGPSGWFPRSLSNRLTGEVPSYAPAASPRVRRRPSPWPPRPATLTDRGVPRTPSACGCALLPSPDPPGFELVGLLERRSAAGSCSYTVPSRLPDPDHLAVLARFGVVGAACHPHPHPRDRAAPASPTRCDGPAAVLVPSPHG